MGSPPAGWISSEPLKLAMVFVMLNEFGVDMLKVIATVAIVETAVKRVRARRSRAFMFNFSPPVLFFIQIIIYSAGNTKPIWSNLLEDYSVADSESELLMQMNERIVKNFLDILVLMELKRSSLTYSELARVFHKKFGEFVNLNLIDSNLNFLENEGLIASRKAKSRKVYALTIKGEAKVRAFLNSKNKILGLLLNLFL
jgi:DNA-binding PadR family transcriptional regulator